MALFTPGQAQRIYESGRTLPPERFQAKLRRAGVEELDEFSLNSCIRRYFTEGRWELVEMLLHRAEELYGVDTLNYSMRAKILWCRGDRDAALILLREKAPLEEAPGHPEARNLLQDLLDQMEEVHSPEASLLRKWQEEERDDRRPGKPRVSLLIYGKEAFDPWQVAATMAVEEWQGSLMNMTPMSPRTRPYGRRKVALWRIGSPLEDAGPQEQLQALLEKTGWSFPPPYRWPLRWSEIAGVEWVRMDIYVNGWVSDGGTARVDSWFSNEQLAALGELGSDLEISRYPRQD